MVYGLGAIEAVLVGRYFAKAFVDCCWYIFLDGRRVVRFLMGVQWGVSWLVVRAVFTTLELECDVEKVDGHGVRFYGDLKAILTEDLVYAFLCVFDQTW